MSQLNTSNLENVIQTAVNSTSPSTWVETLLNTAVAVNNAFGDRTNFVNTVNDLPNIINSSIPTGTIYFVSSLNLHVVSNINQWVGLDGRVLRKDSSVGILWSWGSNAFGQLGDNTAITASKSSPVSVVGGFTDWCQVSSGGYHTAAVRTNGTIWAWGTGSRGQLGNNSSAVRSSPVSVVGGFTDWCQVSAGRYHTAAVRTNGTLWSWGDNSTGGLGDNSTVSKSSPVSVVGGFTDWCQVSAGRNHNQAVRTNRTLWSWGVNTFGQLGDNTIVNKSSPVSVVGGFTDWCQVSAGCLHTAAIRTNGTIWAWGLNSCGQLGDNTIVNKSSPVSVVGGFTDWCQVSVGGIHTAAIRTNGTLWAWGSNYKGQLGHGTATTCLRSSPVSVVGGFTDWCQVSASDCHTAAIRTNGTIWTWGSNSAGQLGNMTATTCSRSSPVSVVGGFTCWGAVSTGINSFSNGITSF